MSPSRLSDVRIHVVLEILCNWQQNKLIV